MSTHTPNQPAPKSKDYGEALTRAGTRITNERDSNNQAAKGADDPTYHYANGLDRALKILEEEYRRSK